MRLIASLTAVTAVAQFAAAAYDGSGPNGGAPAPADGGYGGPGPSGGGGPGYDGKTPPSGDGYDGPKPKAPVPGGPGYDGKTPPPSDGYDGPKPKAPVPGGPVYDGEKPVPGGGKGYDNPKTGGGAPPAPPPGGPGYDGKSPVPSGGYDSPKPSAPVPVPGGPGYDGKGPVPSGGYDGKGPVPSGGYDGPKPSGAAPVPVPGYDNTNKKTEDCKDGGYEGCQGGGDKSKPAPAPTVVNKATPVPQPQSSTNVYSPPNVYTGASPSKAGVPTSIIRAPVQPSATGYTGGGGGGCGGGCGGSGGVITETEVETMMKLSESFEFEVRGGLCAISQMPAQAAVVSWRLVYDLDLEIENKFRFEICEPSDQGRVVTKIKDQYVYGVAVSHKETSSGGVELICDNGGLQKVDVGKERVNVVPVAGNATQEAEGVVYKCSDVSKCKKSSCEADQCRTNLVARVQGNATASATIDYEFQGCKSKDDCYRVQTCVESKCTGQKPPQGSASAPIPVTQVKASTPGEIVGGSGRTNGSDSGRLKGPTSGSASTIVAVNVLAGAVALAFFL